METIIFSIIGLILGGSITFFTSRYFFTKSLQTSELSTYIQFLTEILYDIDPDVEARLKVFYENEIVKEIYQIQYVIANTGDLPIRNLIDPLKLTIPKNGKVLDVSIIHIEPVGRKVEYKIQHEKDNDIVNFTFPLLNSGEYFIVKILIKGSLPYPETEEKTEPLESNYFSEYELFNKYEFSVTADDLPPKLISEPLPPDYETDSQPKEKDYFGFVIVGVLWLACFFPFYFLIYLNTIQPNLFVFNFDLFFNDFSITKLFILFGWVYSTLLFGFSLWGLFWSLYALKPSKEPIFRLPKKLSRDFYKYRD